MDKISDLIDHIKQSWQWPDQVKKVAQTEKK